MKKLIAIDPCIMDTGKPALTVGKEYEPFAFNQSGDFCVINDRGNTHQFWAIEANSFFTQDPEYFMTYSSPIKGPNSKLIEAIELFSSIHPEEEINQINHTCGKCNITVLKEKGYIIYKVDVDNKTIIDNFYTD